MEARGEATAAVLGRHGHFGAVGDGEAHGAGRRRHLPHALRQEMVAQFVDLRSAGVHAVAHHVRLLVLLTT